MTLSPAEKTLKNERADKDLSCPFAIKEHVSYICESKDKFNFRNDFLQIARNRKHGVMSRIKAKGQGHCRNETQQESPGVLTQRRPSVITHPRNCGRWASSRTTGASFKGECLAKRGLLRLTLFVLNFSEHLAVDAMHDVDGAAARRRDRRPRQFLRHEQLRLKTHCSSPQCSPWRTGRRRDEDHELH